MLWDSQAQKIVEASFAMARRQAEHERKCDAERRLDMLEDDWDDELSAYIARLYEPEMFEELKPHISTEHNLFKRIAVDQSQVYKWGALRELGTQSETDKYDILAEETELDETLEQANLYLNALRDLIIMPIVGDDGRMFIELLTPDRITVIQRMDRPTEISAFWFTRYCADTQNDWLSLVYQRSPLNVEKVLVDATHYRVFDKNNKLQTEVEHGLGRLPAVIVHAEKRTRSFFSPTPFGDVYKTNKTVGWLLTALSYLQKMQAELQPTYKGDLDDVAEGTALGASKVLGGKGDWGTLNLQANPDYYLKHINERIKLLAQNYGLSADAYTLGGNPTSGFAFRMQRQPLLEARRKQIKKWRRVENELYVLMAQVSQRFHPIVKLAPDEQFSVNFNEAEFTESPEVENRIDDENVKARRASRIDVIMRRDPDLTRPQAEKKLRRILDDEAMVIGWEKELNASSDPLGDQGLSPRDNGKLGAKVKAAQNAAGQQDGGGDQPPQTD